MCPPSRVRVEQIHGMLLDPGIRYLVYRCVDKATTSSIKAVDLPEEGETHKSFVDVRGAAKRYPTVTNECS